MRTSPHAVTVSARVRRLAWHRTNLPVMAIPKPVHMSQNCGVREAVFTGTLCVVSCGSLMTLTEGPGDGPRAARAARTESGTKSLGGRRYTSDAAIMTAP